MAYEYNLKLEKRASILNLDNFDRHRIDQSQFTRFIMLKL